MRCAVLTLCVLALLERSYGYTTERRHQMRQLARDTWLHAWRAYSVHALPQDELRPLSCTGVGPDRKDPGNWDLNDVMGEYSLTLVDAMPAFALMRDPDGFATAVRDVIVRLRSDNLTCSATSPSIATSECKSSK